MKLDYGKLSQEHRLCFLENALTLYGVDCSVVRAVALDTEYQEVMPESETVYPEDLGLTPTVVATCKVLVNRPIDGLLMSNDVISLSDKVETQFTITTTQLLELEDQLTLTYPDARTIRMRVMERISQHPFTTIGFVYRCLVI